MRIILGLIFLTALFAIPVGYVYVGQMRQIRSDDPRPRALRKNHAQMAQILQRLSAEHEVGATYLAPDDHDQIQQALNQYSQEQ
jgi:hypothetical protein